MSGNTWEEQNWTYEWAKRWGVKLERKALLEVMDKMTEPRIKLDDLMRASKKAEKGGLK